MDVRERAGDRDEWQQHGGDNPSYRSPSHWRDRFAGCRAAGDRIQFQFEISDSLPSAFGILFKTATQHLMPTKGELWQRRPVGFRFQNRSQYVGDSVSEERLLT